LNGNAHIGNKNFEGTKLSSTNKFYSRRLIDLPIALLLSNSILASTSGSTEEIENYQPNKFSRNLEVSSGSAQLQSSWKSRCSTGSDLSITYLLLLPH
jgi:hypothetical protein